MHGDETSAVVQCIISAPFGSSVVKAYGGETGQSWMNEYCCTTESLNTYLRDIYWITLNLIKRMQGIIIKLMRMTDLGRCGRPLDDN
jgi:hypothetical protein